MYACFVVKQLVCDMYKFHNLPYVFVFHSKVFKPYYTNVILRIVCHIPNCVKINIFLEIAENEIDHLKKKIHQKIKI